MSPDWQGVSHHRQVGCLFNGLCGVIPKKTSGIHIILCKGNPSVTGPDGFTFQGAINSLAPERFQFNLSYVIVKLTLVNGGWGIFNEIAHWWMPLDLTGDNSTLVQVMAWCRQATSHYLIQCWPRSLSPNGVTRPQWVNAEFQCHDVIAPHHWQIKALPPADAFIHQ